MARKKTRGNGQGTAYKRGKLWRAEARGFANGTRYRATKSFATKSEALLWAASYTPPNTPSPVMQELFNDWAKQHFPTITESKNEAYERAWARLSPLHQCRITDVSFHEMQNLVSAIGMPYPEREAKTVLVAIYDEGIKNQYVAANIAQHIKIRQPSKPNKDAFTDEELATMWENVHSDFIPDILIMCYTGMRPIELQNFDPKLHLDKTQQHIVGCGAKTELGTTAPILYPAIIEPLLEAHEPLHVTKGVFYGRYERALKAIGVRYLPPNCCRHTCSSMLTRKGVAPAIIKRIMRHTSYKTTLGYTHLQHKDESEAINSILQ